MAVSGFGVGCGAQHVNVHQDKVEKEMQFTRISEAATSQESLESSAKVILNAYRRFRFMRGVNESVSSGDKAALEQLYAKEYQVSVDQYPGIPLFASPKDKHEIEKFLNNWVPAPYQAAVRKVIDVVKYIDFDFFKKRLHKSLIDILSNIKSEGGEKQKYIIIADAEGKSANWVLALAAKDIALHPPEEILDRFDAAKYLNEHPEITNVVMLDDASYSGNQISEYILDILYDSTGGGVRFHVGAPFLTQRAVNLIKKEFEAKNKTRNSLRFAEHYLMVNIAQLPNFFTGVSKEDVLQYELYCAADKALSKFRTLTYFEHKLADKVSTDTMFIRSLIKNLPVEPYKKNMLLRQINQAPKSDRIESIEGGVGKVLGKELQMIKTEKGSFLITANARCSVDIQLNGQAMELKSTSMLPLSEGDVIELGVQNRVKLENGRLCSIS